MTALLEARGVTKSFVGFTAVNDVSFQLQVGEITGLVGSNGAGKTNPKTQTAIATVLCQVQIL